MDTEKYIARIIKEFGIVKDLSPAGIKMTSMFKSIHLADSSMTISRYNLMLSGMTYEGKLIQYVKVPSDKLFDDWYDWTEYWNRRPLKRILIGVRESYNVYFPVIYAPLIIEVSGVFIATTPFGLIAKENYSFAKAIPTQPVIDGEEPYHGKMYYRICLISAGLKTLFGYYRNRNKAIDMSNILQKKGSNPITEYVDTKQDSWFKEEKILG